MLTFDTIVLGQGAFRLTADFVVPASARVAIIGPSGGGKSTLLAALAGFLPPESGRILDGFENLAGAAPKDRPVSILFQDNNLFPHLTVRQNVGLGLRANLRLSVAEWTRVDQALARVGLSDQQEKKPAALSGGQQSRVALARVSLSAKPWVLLDEPFAALGPALKAEMLALVAEVLDETGAGLLMVTHDPADATALCDLTVVVAQGAAVAPMNTADLFANPTPDLQAYLGQ